MAGAALRIRRRRIRALRLRARRTAMVRTMARRAAFIMAGRRPRPTTAERGAAVFTRVGTLTRMAASPLNLALKARARTSLLAPVIFSFLILSPRLASAQTASIANNSVRTLLSWLDDAEVLEQGSGEVSLAFSRVDTASGHQIEAPALFAAVGVAPRVQVAASGLYASSTFSDGVTSSGRGDTYLVGKVAVISPREHPGGIAISPLVEILSDVSVAARADGGGRVAWGLPISFQYTWTKVQVLATTGYFSRGSVFADAGVQAWVAQHAIGTISVAHSHATSTTVLSEKFGLSRDRTDLTGGLDWLITPNVTIFGTVGRTLGTLDATGSTSIVTVGLSVHLAGRDTAGGSSPQVALR